MFQKNNKQTNKQTRALDATPCQFFSKLLYYHMYYTIKCLDLLNLCTLVQVSEEIFGHNQSISQCFQVQLVTCFDLPLILQVYLRGSSKMIGNFLEALNFNRLFLKLNRFIYNLWSVLHIHCISMFNQVAFANRLPLYPCTYVGLKSCLKNMLLCSFICIETIV